MNLYRGLLLLLFLTLFLLGDNKKENIIAFKDLAYMYDEAEDVCMFTPNSLKLKILKALEEESNNKVYICKQIAAEEGNLLFISILDKEKIVIPLQSTMAACRLYKDVLSIVIMERDGVSKGGEKK